MYQKQSTSGFGTIGVIAVVAVVALASLGGWFVYHQNHTNKSNNTQTSSSNKNTGQHQTTNTGNTGTTQPATDTYLDVKELGVKFKLTDPIKDAYYKVKGSTKNGKPVVALYLHSLDTYPNCSPANDPDGFAAVMTFTPGAQDPVNGDFESAYPNAPLINGLHYYIAPAQYDCTGGAVNISPMRDAFNTAYKTITTD